MAAQSRQGILSLAFAIMLLAVILTGCGSQAASPQADRPPVPADRVEIVLFHRTMR